MDEKMTFVPSPQQVKVFEFVEQDKGNAFIEAVAGDGKTTTIIEACKRMNGTIAFAAFNKAIADEINEKIQKIGLGNRVRAGTFHSFGFSAWRRVAPNVKVDAAKKQNRVKELLNLSDEMNIVAHKAVSFAKQRAITPANSNNDSVWYDLIEHYDLEADLEEESIENLIEACKLVLKMHFSMRHELIDFDDMIWLPIVTGTRVWQNDWVLVDEAQDSNPARRALARKMLKPNGRAIFVGDRHQAIYFFAGADSDAVDQIVKDFNCKLLPLTVTYRCAKDIVNEARKIVNHIEAHPNASVGTVETIEYNDWKFVDLKKTDAIICRNTKPLVKLAYTLIANNIPCHVEGRDIGKGLEALVNKWKSIKRVDKYLEKLNDWADVQYQKLIAKKKDLQADSLRDRVETVAVICKGCHTLDEVRQKINKLFSDTKEGEHKDVTLCTAHRSKGREFDRVFILGWNRYMPSPMARTVEQQEQEENLRYVAVTRAENTLVFVNVPTKEEKA